MSDQERISLDIVSAISSTQVMRITKNRYKGILVDPIPNSPKLPLYKFLWQIVRRINGEISGVKGLSIDFI